MSNGRGERWFSKMAMGVRGLRAMKFSREKEEKKGNSISDKKNQKSPSIPKIPFEAQTRAPDELTPGTRANWPTLSTHR